MSKTNYTSNPRPGASSARLIWLQCVPSKSGNGPHMVRCFDNGVISCDCEGFGWAGRCSHQATGKLQEAREALAQAATAAPTPRRTAAPLETLPAYVELFG